MTHLKMPKNKNIGPPLKWAGGKRWLIPRLLTFWEQYNSRRLVEPLCGGLAVTLGLMPDQALLNDINVHLINFFNWAKNGLYIDMPMKNEKEFFYSSRERFNSLLAEGKEKTKEAAELFYYLNRTGYNGLCRFNRKGFFNVPFGRYAKINYVRDFSKYQEIFAGWDLVCSDFEALSIDKDDFIYADPPYDVDFIQYSEQGFTWDDQVRLGKWLAGHTGPVLLSNQATSRIVSLYKDLGFKLIYLNAPRMISCTGDRTPAKEVLAMKGF